MRTVIFLGAGASAAEGAPIQNSIIREYLNNIENSPQGTSARMDREIARFFKTFFPHIKHSSAPGEYPTFEEVLGLLDFSERRQESFRQFPTIDTMPRNSSASMRDCLVLMMAKALDAGLRNINGLHQQLVNSLTNQHLAHKIIFASTNYDILIDNALGNANPLDFSRSLDYGIDFTNFDTVGSDWSRPQSGAFRLFKLHGSLNWLLCRTCNEMTLTPYEKGVMRLLTDMARCKCTKCGTLMAPLIVPPTFFKDMSNIFLNTIWHKFETELRTVDHIIFCGYSFPDADIHIKYMLKRVQMHKGNSLRFSVLNNHEGKTHAASSSEKERFERFLGSNYVKYTDKSFAHLASDIRSFL